MLSVDREDCLSELRGELEISLESFGLRGTHEAPTPGWPGEVEELTLLDLLQMYHYGRRSLVIELSGALDGRVYLRAGELVHAQAGDQRGVAALGALLQASGGFLRTLPLPHLVEASLAGDFEALILDALRRIDEAARDAREFDEAELERDLDDSFAEFTATPAPATSVLGAALGDLQELEGFAGACLVDSRTGCLLAHVAGSALPDADAGSRLLAAQLPLLLSFAKGGLDDVVITVQGQHHLLRPAPESGGRFLYLVLHRGHSNLALARLLLAAAATDVGAMVA